MEWEERWRRRRISRRRRRTKQPTFFSQIRQTRALVLRWISLIDAESHTITPTNSDDDHLSKSLLCLLSLQLTRKKRKRRKSLHSTKLKKEPQRLNGKKTSRTVCGAHPGRQEAESLRTELRSSHARHRPIHDLEKKTIVCCDFSTNHPHRRYTTTSSPRTL